MTGAFSPRRHLASAVAAAAVGALVVLAGGQPAAAGPGHTTAVSAAPSTATPNVMDGRVYAIYDAGSKVIVGGTFTYARNRNSSTDITRNYLLAYTKSTGAIDTSFAPTVDAEVRAISAGPTPGTVLVAGKFGMINDTKRRKLAVLNVSNGSLTSWQGPAINGRVNATTVVDGKLLIGGQFTTIGGVSRPGLASLDFASGALTSYLTTALTENHNYDGTGAVAGVGGYGLAVSPDKKQLVVIGNFKKADGVVHNQVVKLDLGGSSATITNWNTTSYAASCNPKSFDHWVRDVAFSPDGSYFVIVTTGGPYSTTLCDTAVRWNANATGSNVQPAWIERTGGDTLLSVAITEEAVYVGGHQRWLNNSLGSDSAAPGAVTRAGIAALDPVNGVPLKWNPGRNPRGYGATELVATSEGLYVGHDTAYIGNKQYYRRGVAFFPLSGGAAVHGTNTSGLPGKVYLAGNVKGAGANDIVSRTYDGTTAGADSAVSNSAGITWSSTRGAFWVGGTLFYAQNSSLYRQSFNGTTFGSASAVNPYSDPTWDNVDTGSGQTFKGSTTNFYGEIQNVTGMFYAGGRLYYTLRGQSGLFYRYFTPDSGIVAPDRFTVSGATGFGDAGGVFVADGKLYMTNRNTGALSVCGWTGTATTGSLTIVSGPTKDGRDWRGQAVFLAP